MSPVKVSGVLPDWAAVPRKGSVPIGGCRNTFLPFRLMVRKRLLLVVSLLTVPLVFAGVAAYAAAARPVAFSGLPYQDPSLPVAQRVADLLSRMTVDDKVGQM